MIFGIIKDGVRSAFVRIVRYIVFAILILLAVYVIGLFTNNKASALVKKAESYDPDIQSKSQQYGWQNSGDYTQWFHFVLDSDLTINNDYDLIGFKFNRLNYIMTPKYTNTITTGEQTTGGYGYTEQITLQPETWVYGNYGQHITFNGIMFDDNGTGYICYLSSEVENTFLCPITRGMKVHTFSLITNVTVPPNWQLNFTVEIERNKTFYNYDVTEIIDSNGQIVNQQTITNNYIQDNTTTGSQTQATNSLNTISGQFNDVLNGWGGQWSDLTHVALEPINVVLYAFDGSTTCQPITLNVPFMQNKQVILPCMGSIYSTYFSTFITLFVMIMSGLYGYRTIMYVLRTIKDVMDAENDKIEVIDL